MTDLSKLYKPFSKILVANRGEIAIRIFRAAAELGISTVAIYTFEDRHSLHRYKSDESYQIGENDEPLKPYLNIDEIIRIAKFSNAEAIHPGYGFLSENSQLARRCHEEGIVFIGPLPKTLEMLGDKVQAKKIVKELKIPFIPENERDPDTVEVALSEAEKIGYPVMLKASFGGGGRGMRMCKSAEELSKEFQSAKNEAAKAFSNDTLFIEKYVMNPKHIEVQILGDTQGNIIHLYERDCSVQRRFQKVVEFAPALSISDKAKQQLYNYAIQIARKVDYINAGTVEFLVDEQENIYFIEVNPRIQVEHTVTEEVTSIDLVRTQILIAQGKALAGDEIKIYSQSDIRLNGCAIQCRVTTEDPLSDFKPDFGIVSHYRNASGFSIRLDEGSSYPGMRISPYFDSLLVKVTASGRNLSGASSRLIRTLREFRIRGVKTNIGFLLNVLKHPEFRDGKTAVTFIEKNPSLFDIEEPQDSGSKLVSYLGNIIINRHPNLQKVKLDRTFEEPVFPHIETDGKIPPGTKQKLEELGREDFVKWLRNEKKIHYTDTTLRDAHQSLFATRMRTYDMIKISKLYSYAQPQTFSLEMWGGATFDASMNFLRECPWDRLKQIRHNVPNILLQMLLRGSNAVGYKAYPDNLVVAFIEKAAETGIDIFRIFDSLNWLENMKVSIQAVIERTNSLAEVALCYTGDVLSKHETKYNLNYYTDMAKRIEDTGAHILAIKDMAGLLKPYAAEVLIKKLRETVKIPIHLHTHDSSSNQHAMYLKAIESDVDVIDVAIASMSGGTSQPNFNSIVAMMEGQPREHTYDLPLLNKFSTYWEQVREFYYPFDSGVKSGTAEIYEHQMPGGQYTNLKSQAVALELGDRFEDVKQNYIVANKILGNIVKVTPSSKVVGDMSLFMTSHHLTEEEIKQRGNTLNFPESVKELLRGEIGQTPGGFPEWFSKMVLKDEKPYDKRPNEYLSPIDLDEAFEAHKQKYPQLPNYTDFLSSLMYPKVFDEYYKHFVEFSRVDYIPTQPFFYGLKTGEEVSVRIKAGKTINIKLISVTMPDESGNVTLSFDINGQYRRILVKDKNVKSTVKENLKATEINHIGSPLMGKISSMLVKEGEEVAMNQSLFVIEAMKMETTVTSNLEGVVAKIYLKMNDTVDRNDLVIEIKTDINKYAV